MRHLDKSYPYQKPSKNRSSKNLNMILGRVSIFPAYRTWSDKDLIKRANQCKNKENNCFLDELNFRKKERETKKIMAAKRKQMKKPVNDNPANKSEVK